MTVEHNGTAAGTALFLQQYYHQLLQEQEQYYHQQLQLRKQQLEQQLEQQLCCTNPYVIGKPKPLPFPVIAGLDGPPSIPFSFFRLGTKVIGRKVQEPLDELRIKTAEWLGEVKI